MYAVVQIGSAQYKVSEGDQICVDRLSVAEGEDFALDKVLMFAKDGDIRVGTPYIKDAKVTTNVLRHTKGKKVTTLKYRRTKDSATKTGHREKLTDLSVVKIDIL